MQVNLRIFHEFPRALQFPPARGFFNATIVARKFTRERIIMQPHYESLPPVKGVNFIPLTPIAFLRRAADTYPEHPAIIYGDRQFTWREFARRCRWLAAGLAQQGVTRGATVSVIAANTPELAEAHYGIPMGGGVINAVNTRLDAATVAYILEHGDCQVLITDTHFSATVEAALAKLKTPPIVIDIVDAETPAPAECKRLGAMTYEELLARGEAAETTAPMNFDAPQTEWDALALNYTSGTTAKPKGVVYHHRGGYLMALGTVATWQLPKHPRYLYIVPMFHCNGWGHVWTMAIMGGTIVCNRTMTADAILQLIARHKVTHMAGAPIILAMLAEAEAAARRILPTAANARVRVMTAGAPPPAKILEKVENLGFDVLHVYGLTETYGHIMGCDWRAEWDELPRAKRAELKARQGVRMPMMEAARVLSADGKATPADGQTLGEIVLTGNTVMKGYYKNPQATDAAFRGGWFHSGDLAVAHPDGYMEIKDRLKDIIISGGENISSIEVESVLYKHPAVAAAAVVAKPDAKWGETPCAFVELKPGKSATADEIIQFCREHLSGFKRPKHVVFMELPKTSTGKIQKFQLRERARHDAPES